MRVSKILQPTQIKKPIKIPLTVSFILPELHIFENISEFFFHVWNNQRREADNLSVTDLFAHA